MASYRPEVSITIPNPCEKKRWEELPGDAQARFCDGCRREVHNLAAMTPKQIEALLTGPFSEDNPVPCVRMAPNDDGSMMVAEEQRQPIRFAQIAAATMSAVAMASVAGCKSQTAPMGTVAKTVAVNSAQAPVPVAKASGPTVVTGTLVDNHGDAVPHIPVLLFIEPTDLDPEPEDAHGLALWLKRHHGDQVRTDSHGKFHLKAEEPGTYLFRTRDNYLPGSLLGPQKSVVAGGGEIDLGVVECRSSAHMMGTVLVSPPILPPPPPPKRTYILGEPKRIDVPSASRPSPLQPVGGPAPTAPRAVSLLGTGASLLSMPAPVYTDEAKALKLEGVVKVRIRVKASGSAEVLGVDGPGLGHGLDEAALDVARKSRFQAATDSPGHPIDWDGTLSVTFKLKPGER